MNQSLLSYNEEGALSHLLAMEEHLSGQESNGININSWCFRKHGLLAKNHHFLEMKSLLEESDPEKVKEIEKIIKQLDRELESQNPTASGIRELRNEFREIINDPTLEQPQKVCGVCALDKSSKMEKTNFASREQLVYDDDDQFEKIPDVEKSPQKTHIPTKVNRVKKSSKKGSSALPLLIIGGIVVIGAIALIASRRV